MRFVLLLALLGLGFGCGKEIGDACFLAIDCSPNGDRQCDTASPGGYCTIQGCDFNTCPEESTCVRFFTGNFSNRDCSGDGDCSLDELCALSKKCVPRSSEIRFCMRTCDSNGDCRDGYECRDLNKMIAHGGEPVVEPGSSSSGPKFCAPAPD